MELCPSLHLNVVPTEKEAFGPPSTTVANFTFICPKVNAIARLEFELAD